MRIASDEMRKGREKKEWKGRESKGREWKGRKGKRREGKGREGEKVEGGRRTKYRSRGFYSFRFCTNIFRSGRERERERERENAP